jgi:hypothetical protein
MYIIKYFISYQLMYFWPIIEMIELVLNIFFLNFMYA